MPDGQLSYKYLSDLIITCITFYFVLVITQSVSLSGQPPPPEWLLPNYSVLSPLTQPFSPQPSFQSFQGILWNSHSVSSNLPFELIFSLNACSIPLYKMKSFPQRALLHLELHKWESLPVTLHQPLDGIEDEGNSSHF